MKELRQSAFTLVECVIALMIIALAAVGCYWGTSAAAKVSQLKLDQPVAWYHFLNKLEGPQWGFRLDQVESSGRRVQLVSNDNEKYQLLVSGAGMIYLRKVKSAGGRGYLPLYGPVVAKDGMVLHQLDDRRVRIEVKIREYPKQSATLCFAPNNLSEKTR